MDSQQFGNAILRYFPLKKKSFRGDYEKQRLLM